MVHKRFPPDDPREWLNRARSNLVLARKAIPGVYLEDLCFDAQQSAEKAIKAVFIHRGESFPYVHNLEDLLRRLERNGVKIPKYVRKAHELTRFAARRVTLELLDRFPKGNTADSFALPNPSSAGPSARLESHDPNTCKRLAEVDFWTRADARQHRRRV